MFKSQNQKNANLIKGNKKKKKKGFGNYRLSCNLTLEYL